MSPYRHRSDPPGASAGRHLKPSKHTARQIRQLNRIAKRQRTQRSWRGWLSLLGGWALIVLAAWAAYQLGAALAGVMP